MTCTSRNQDFLDRAAKYIAIRDKLDDAYLAAVTTGDVKSYKFDSTEGAQWTTFRSLTEMQDALDSLDARINHFLRKAGPGGGVVLLNLRRKNYHYSYSCGCTC